MRRVAAWPAIGASAAVLEDARALADDTSRPVDERLAALGRLGAAAADPTTKRACEAFQKAVATGRFRNWSDLVSYAGFMVAPVARGLGEAAGVDETARRHLDAYCVMAHLLDLIVHCRTEYSTHDRIFLPGDWMRAAGVAPEALAAPRSAHGLRDVFRKMLDRIEPALKNAYAAARGIGENDLRVAILTGIAERRRLARRLRRADPLARLVRLTALDRTAVAFRILFDGRRPK